MAGRDDVVIRISAKNLTKAEIDKARRQLDGLEKSGRKAGKSFVPLRKEVRRVADNFAQMNPLTSSASRLTSGMNLAVVGAAGAIAGLGLATVAGVKHLTDLGVQFTTLRDKTKLSLGFLQEMKFASDQVNVGFDQVTQSVVRLGRRTAADLPETRRFIEGLGLSMDEIVAMKPEQQFLKIVDSISKLKNPSQQAAAAMGIFGDAGLQLLPLIRNDVEALRDEFDDLGGKIDDETLESARKFDDAMTSLKANISGLVGNALGPLVVKLAEVADGFLKAQKAGRNFGGGGLFAEDETLRKLNQELISLVGPGGLSDAEKERVKQIERQIELRQEVLDQVSRLEGSLRDAGDADADAADAAGGVVGNFDKADKKVKGLKKSSIDLDAAIRQFEGIKQFQDNVDAARARIDAASESTDGIEQAMVAAGLAANALADRSDVTKETLVDIEQAQLEYNKALAAAADLTQIIGGNIGQFVGQTLAAGSALQNLSSLGGGGGIGGILGGVGAAFKSGKGEGTGLLGAISGIASAAGPVGAIAGVGIQLGGMLIKAFGRGADDVIDDVTRDIGTGISDGLAKQILESGENAQLFLREIFAEGNLGIDDLARETGDLFSMFERGELSEGSLVRELKETVPILIQNFKDLGPAGQGEIERIIAASDRLGVSIDGIGQLMQASFAPDTMEQIAAQFGITNDQVRELADLAGVKLQTDLERTAQTLGLSVEETRKLAEVMKERYGKSLEETLPLLEALGADATKLAEGLGVDVGITDGTEKAASDTQEAANWATVFADEIERAGRAAAGFSIPGARGGGVPQFAEGADFIARGPQLGIFGENGPERVTITPLSGGGSDSRGGGGDTIIMNMPIDLRGAVGIDQDKLADSLAPVIKRVVERNVAGAKAKLQKALV